MQDGDGRDDANGRAVTLIRRAGLEHTADLFPEDVAAALAAADAMRAALTRVADVMDAPWPPARIGGQA